MEEPPDWPEASGWRRHVSRQLHQIRGKLGEIRSDLSGHRSDEIVDRIQDIESSVTTLEQEVEGSTWASVVHGAATDWKVALLLILIFAVMVTGLMTLAIIGVDLTAIFGETAPLLSGTVSLRAIYHRLGKRVQQEDDPDSGHDDQEEADGSGVLCIEQMTALGIGAITIIVWTAVVSLVTAIAAHIQGR